MVYFNQQHSLSAGKQKPITNKMEEQKMKKFLALALVLCMVFALCACGGSTGSTAAPAESAAPAEESAEPAPADASMYEVTEPITIIW